MNPNNGDCPEPIPARSRCPDFWFLGLISLKILLVAFVSSGEKLGAKVGVWHRVFQEINSVFEALKAKS
jgi:hypothetical protein